MLIFFYTLSALFEKESSLEEVCREFNLPIGNCSQGRNDAARLLLALASDRTFWTVIDVKKAKQAAFRMPKSLRNAPPQGCTCFVFFTDRDKLFEWHAMSVGRKRTVYAKGAKGMMSFGETSTGVTACTKELVHDLAEQMDTSIDSVAATFAYTLRRRKRTVLH